jgi:tRNA (cmo5U34)-methyltransferase
MLDIGCGAGNFTIKMLDRLPGLKCSLVDLSLPMLEKAIQRLESTTAAKVDSWQDDIRSVTLPEAKFDIVVAAAVLHHLRDGRQWESVFAKLYAALRPGGILLVSDLIDFELDSVRKIQTERYGHYLSQFKGEEYRDQVFAYIAKEDSPRSLAYQTQLAWETGFRQVDILHANACFGAYVAVK